MINDTEKLKKMLKKNTENVLSKMIRTKNGRLQLKSQCSICGNKKK